MSKNHAFIFFSKPCSNAQHFSWGQCCSINTVYTVTLCTDGTVTLTVCVRVRACAPPQLLILSSIAYLDYMCMFVLFISRNNSKDLRDRHRFPRMHCQHVASFGVLAHLTLFVMEAPLQPAGVEEIEITSGFCFCHSKVIFILITDLALSVFVMFMTVNKYLGLLWETFL